MNKINIDLSIIVPVYNVKNYFSACIDSLLNQGELRLEIILVNDGSTDCSGKIAEEYAKKDSQIIVIHKENGGASTARNVGLELAQGKYIAFIDSDDWVKENGLFELYQEAAKHQADMIIGKTLFCVQDGNMKNPYNPVPYKIKYIPLSGKECYIRLQKVRAYVPMACNNIYRKKFLDRIQIRFEEGIMLEDELWTPTVLCQAEKVVIIDLNFYFYRQQDDSVMHSTNISHRLKSMFRVTEKLFEFADRFDFSGEDAELKNWLYVNIFKLYSITFKYVSRLKDSSIILQDHHLNRFLTDCPQMMPEPKRRCREYFRNAKAGLEKYNNWLNSCWVTTVPSLVAIGKKLMLIYNTKGMMDLDLKFEDIPEDWVITTDRRYFQQADAVVFYLPNLSKELECDFDKPQNQIWVAWYMDPCRIPPDMKEIFDLQISYRQDDDVVYPYYRYEYKELLYQQVFTENKQNKICILESNRNSINNQHDYLKELKKSIEIDFHGNSFKNAKLSVSERMQNKLDTFGQYKFVIAFEDAVEPDYVTDKFFDPLLAGSVPVYLGALNIEDFAPGDNCFVDVRKFENPQSLADFINACCEDEQLYAQFFEWKNKPLRQSFLQKIEEQKEHPLVRLCRKVDETTQ